MLPGGTGVWCLGKKLHAHDPWRIQTSLPPLYKHKCLGSGLYYAAAPATHRHTAAAAQVTQTLIRAYFSPAATTGQRFIYSGSAGDNSVCVWDVVTGATLGVAAFTPCVRPLGADHERLLTSMLSVIVPSRV